MADRIKGITIQIGGDTAGLNKALSGTNKEIKNTQSQLKDVERLLKLDPTNTELLAQKQRLLAEAVEETSGKLDVLKTAEKQVQDQFERGDISRQQYDSLKREIIETEHQLGKLESDAQAANKAVAKIDESPVEDVQSAAKKAGDALDDAGKKASNFADYLKAGAIVEGAKGIISSFKDLAEESKEHNKIMGSLEVSSQKAGYTSAQTEEAYKKLYGVLGDDQTTATTLANLQAIGLSQSNLISVIDQCIGAWTSYGDSIPIDSLAESINETIKSGQVTGTFADVLNWGAREGETFGVKMKANTEANKEWNESVAACETAEDYFNLALQSAGDETERANLVLGMMANQGLKKTGEAWQKNNAALVENNQANAELQDQIASLSEMALPIITRVTEGISGLLEWFNGLDQSTQMFIITAVALVAALGPVTTAIDGIKTLILDLAKNPIVILIAAIVALVALVVTKGQEIIAGLEQVDSFLQGVFMTDWTKIFGPGLGDALNSFFAIFSGIWNSIKQIFEGVINFIQGIFTWNWEQAWLGVQQIFSGIFSGLEAIVKAPINGVIGLLNGAVGALNMLISGINSIGFDTPDWLGGWSWHPSIPLIPNIPYLAKGGFVQRGMAIVGEAGPELLTVGPQGTAVQPLESQGYSKTTNYGGVNVTVYGAPGQNVNELANIIMEKIESATARKGAVYA